MNFNVCTVFKVDQISGLDSNTRFNNPGVYGKFMGECLPIFN
jgi:hypothetical protein